MSLIDLDKCIVLPPNTFCVGADLEGFLWRNPRETLINFDGRIDVARTMMKFSEIHDRKMQGILFRLLRSFFFE